MKNIKKNSNGVTLIALVITIIVLLILAGVSIAMLTGDNGILNQAINSKEETIIAEQKEQISLAYNSAKVKNVNEKVLATDLYEEFLANGLKNVQTSGENPIIIIFDDKKSYTLDTDGKINLVTGNAKEILDNASTTYGAVVTNYDIDSSTGVHWKIFNSDGINIYLIADDYVNYEIIPNSKENNKLNRSDSYPNSAYFTNVLNDYNGSSDITNNNPTYKWLNKYYEKQYISENKNMKAVAYMLDTNIWNKFKEDTALYSVGGPTLEMLFSSYNNKYKTSYEFQAANNIGYLIRKTPDEEWSARIPGLFETTDELYTINNKNSALSYWIASPSNYSSNQYDLGAYLLSTYYSGSVTYSFYDAKDIGFRPVVCLKNNINLILQKDGTYKIQ